MIDNIPDYKEDNLRMRMMSFITKITLHVEYYPLVILPLLVVVFLCGWMWRRQRPLLHPHHYPSSNRKIGIKRSLSNLGLCLRVTELPTNKSHLTNLMTVQGKLSKETYLERVREIIGKDPFFARYRSIVVGKEFVEIPNYDVAQNLFEYTLEKGQTALNFAEKRVNAAFDPTKALWEMYVLHPHRSAIDPDKTYVLYRMHHCIGDGASVSQSVIKLSDEYRMNKSMRTIQSSASSSPPPPGMTIQSLVETLQSIVWFLRSFLWAWWVIVGQVYTMGRRQEPRTIFKRTGSRDKRLACTTQYSVSKTKEIGHKYHATLNDIMLSCIAGAMRKVMTVTGTNPQQIPEDLVLCATIPANMRPLDEELRVPGNKWMSLFLDLPVGMTDPIKRLICVRDASRQVKEPLVKQLLYLLGHLTIACPDDIIRFVIYWFCKRTSVAITNVCGSSQALNMCGRKALSFVGFVPCPAYINLGIALVSIGDQLGLNVAIDQVMNVAPETFLTFVEEEYETLQNLTSETNKKKIKYQ